ncbi:16650_t:CDS:2, partial [Dentiscutata erythropus]
KWRAQKLQIEALKPTQDLSLKKARVLSSHGHKPKYLVLEQELVKYIKEKRDEGLSITISIIVTKARELAKTLELGFAASGYKLPPMVIFKLQKVPKRQFPRNVVVAAAPNGTMHKNLMLSTYISKVIRARPESFFKNKDILFVDCHTSYTHDEVIKALNAEGLEVIKIPGGTTREREFTKSGNRKKASYELVCNQELLIKSFEASGLTLNPDGSEDTKMSNQLQAIVENRLDDVTIEELDDEGPTANEFDCEDSYDDYDESDEEISNEEISNDEFDARISNDEYERISDNEFDNKINDEFSIEYITYNKFDDKESCID